MGVSFASIKATDSNAEHVPLLTCSSFHNGPDFANLCSAPHPENHPSSPSFPHGSHAPLRPDPRSGRHHAGSATSPAKCSGASCVDDEASLLAVSRASVKPASAHVVNGTGARKYCAARGEYCHNMKCCGDLVCVDLAHICTGI
eukprot:7464880-Heterocapsa_arctica.AAC.1